MEVNTAWDALVNAASGVALVALAAWVASIKPPSAVTRALALFAGALGAILIVWNLRQPDASHLSAWWYQITSLALGAAATASIFVIAFSVPPPRPRNWRTLLAIAAPVGALRVGTTAVKMERTGWAADEFAVALSIAAMYMALVVFALRFRSAPDRGRRTQLGLMSGALLLYAGVVAAASLGPNASLAGISLAEMLTASIAHLVVGLLWVANLVARPPGSTRTARNVVLLVFAVPLVAIIVRLAFGHTFSPVASGPHWGAARFLMVALLAYAILRHQLLDIDVKIKWTLKQSSVAAVFIAVFFIVSEGAAALFEAQTGSKVAGILAAGALVFAIAPLQRMAERVADKAMPGVKAVGQMDEDERVALYREQLRIAYADGSVDGRERRLLQGTRDQLGLSLELAERLEQEVVEEAGAA